MTVVVEIRDLYKTFNNFTAVDGISFAVEQGSALSLLGPSGCGKTTTLRCIAGLEQPDRGEVLIGGEIVAAPSRRIMAPAEKRGLGMVFQSYAIWPHMTVFENIAYGLRARSTPASDIKPRVLRVLEQTRLVGLENRYPSELSGGQQQRVALARALVYAPKVLLMDEPLSNLDARLREQTRVELREIQARLGITTIYVTHDQQEALTMSDQIAVMNAGRIFQMGTPEEIYNRPSSRFAAEFVGRSNLLDGVVSERSNGVEGRVQGGSGPGSWSLRCTVPMELNPGSKVTVLIRPEHWHILADSDETEENQFRGQIERRIFLGSSIEYHVDTGGSVMVVQAPPHLSFSEGSTISLRVDPRSVVVLPED